VLAIGYCGVSYVTQQSLTPIPLSPSSFSLGGATGVAVSRDGERLIIAQDDGVSPVPALLYMNAADSVIQSNMGGVTSIATVFSISDTVNRLLINNQTLVDGNFNSVGAADIPVLPVSYTYIPLRAVVSPDGSRVYVLTSRRPAPPRG
jgi:DNA-binding beta-propeller fold protein YncE